MPISHEFEYFKPLNLAEALELKAKYGAEAKILAGGTDLVNAIKEDFVAPQALIDIKAIKDLNILQFDGNNLIIGANVTFTEIIESDIVNKNFKLLSEASETVASNGTRNRATMLGNICSAVPSCDAGPSLLVFDAIIKVISKNGERDIPIEEWFTGPKRTALKDDEIAAAIIVPMPGQNYKGYYGKLGRYNGEDLAQAGVSVIYTEDKNYKIAFGAVGPTPKRGKKIEEALRGNAISDALINKAKELVMEEISPISDIRASKEYRYHMVQVMLEDGLKKVTK